jgi:hypothetical protein
MVLTQVFGEKSRERIANGFRGVAAENPLGGTVGHADQLITVKHDDGIHRRIDDPGEPGLTLLQRYCRRIRIHHLNFAKNPFLSPPIR